MLKKLIGCFINVFGLDETNWITKVIIAMRLISKCCAAEGIPSAVFSCIPYTLLHPRKSLLPTKYICPESCFIYVAAFCTFCTLHFALFICKTYITFL